MLSTWRTVRGAAWTAAALTLAACGIAPQSSADTRDRARIAVSAGESWAGTVSDAAHLAAPDPPSMPHESSRRARSGTGPRSAADPSPRADDERDLPRKVVVNTPAQPAALMYGGGESRGLAYAEPGGLVVAGRDNYQHEVFTEIADSGGTVLIYIDPLIDSTYGRYQSMLLEESRCGAAVPRWPGNPEANEWGNLTDFRVGSTLQRKLECVAVAMAEENPHMGGWFVDDVGSRSWYPRLDWESWSGEEKRAYREGAIAITETFRRVADRYGAVFLVNGTWTAGDVDISGGGYPDVQEHGNALADGGVVELHDGSVDYFGPYGCADQWAGESASTEGEAIMFAITASEAGRDAYAGTGCFAYLASQTDYGTAPVPWTDFHPSNLPTGAVER